MAKKKTSRAKKSASPKPPFWRRLGKWIATLFVWGMIGSLFVVGWFYTGLPDIEDSLAPSRRPTLWIMAADGQEIAAVGDLYGIPVKLSDLPPALPQAVLATEDRRFYDHFGIDLIGLARAMVTNIRAGRIVQGGSTITQQVAKNMYLWSGKSFLRKGIEAYFTVLIEVAWSKKRILEVYVNIAEFGPGIYGVGAASAAFFGKSPVELSDAKAAFLAAVLPNPKQLRVDNPTPYVRERQNWIIKQMQRLRREQ